MKKIDFKDRIQSNPRLLRLRNPSTGEIIDYEIQDLLENEIVQDGTEVSSNVLNKMQDNIEESCVVVSPTEPTTNEKVWIQKGKNLFNPNTMVEFVGKYRPYNMIAPVENTGFNSIKVPVEPNLTYAVSTDGNSHSQLSFYDESFNYISGEPFANGTTFTTPANCFYITMAVASDYTWIQIEQGSTATEYEAYVKRKINVDGEDFFDVDTNNQQITSINNVLNNLYKGKGFTSDTNIQTYSLSPLSIYLVAMSNIGSSNANDLSMFIVATGASSSNTGQVLKVSGSNNNSVSLSGLTLTCTSSSQWMITTVNKLNK